MPRDALPPDNPAMKDFPLSPAVRAGDLLYLSGQVGLDPAGKLPDDIKAQTANALANLDAVLKRAGKSLDDVVKANIFITDMADYGAMNEAYAKAFTKPYPARTCVAVAALPLGARVEIEVIAR